jgi:hypothetical protein
MGLRCRPIEVVGSLSVVVSGRQTSCVHWLLTVRHCSAS